MPVLITLMVFDPETRSPVSRLTGAQGRRRDLDLAGGLVRLESRGSAACAEVCSKQVGALGACGAGTGAITAMMGFLFIIYSY